MNQFIRAGFTRIGSSRARLMGAIFIGAGLCGAGIIAGSALAGSVPTQSPLVWGGTVTDDAGKAYMKAMTVNVAFFDSATATTPKCVSPSTQTDAKTGRFAVTLPSTCVSAVHSAKNLWSETTADGKKLPRVHVGAVPYALQADMAHHATGALATQLSELTKDVTKLKSAGNGVAVVVVMVKDANGIELGSVVSPAGAPSLSIFYVKTKTGYIFRTYLDKPFLTPLYFLASSCAGDALVLSSSNTARSNSEIFPLVAGNVTRWHRPSGKLNNWVVGKKLKFSSKSIFNSIFSKCQTSTSASATAFVVKAVKMTTTQVNLPTQIAYPLTLTSPK